MSTRLMLALIAALLIVRLPSLAQPMGPDQGLYAYVGERILDGELAWDPRPTFVGLHHPPVRRMRRMQPHCPRRLRSHRLEQQTRPPRHVPTSRPSATSVTRPLAE